MGVLIVVSELQGGSTVFELARRMALAGERIDILFTGEACRCACDPGLVGSLGFAEGLHCLEPDLRKMGDEEPARGVRLIGYQGWVDLVEADERIVSWA